MRLTDPERLSEGQELSDELRLALRELASEEPGAQAVQQVQQTLDALSAALPRAGLSLAVKVASFTSLTTVAVVVAIGLRSAPEPHGERRALPAVVAAPSVAPDELSANGRSNPESAATATPSSVDESGGAANATAAHHAPRAERTAPATRPVLRARTVRAAAHSSAGTRAPAPSITAPHAQMAAPHAQSAPGTQERAPLSEPHASPPRAQEGEAALLYRVRQAALRDEQQALMLLDTHRRLFPEGVLAEEREFIAIQLYRQLGDSQAADAQRARFRARFPRSSYAQLLEP